MSTTAASQRVRYYEDRERLLSPRMEARYCIGDEALNAFRMVCVDRIWRLSYIACAHDSTAFAAVRLFDRCMSATRPPICRTNMSLLTVACFDICFKSTDGDFKPPLMSEYYTHGFLSKYNEHIIPMEKFGIKLREVQITVLKHVKGEPSLPTPYDYIVECCPTWVTTNLWNTVSRRANLAVAAFSYVASSTNYTSEQIAGAAVHMALGDTHAAPTLEMLHLASDVLSAHELVEVNTRMLCAIDSLFAISDKTSLYAFYYDMYREWRRFHTDRPQNV